MKVFGRTVILIVCAFSWSHAQAQTPFTDPSAVLAEHFWGDLYAEGGQTFFCNTSFSSRGLGITEGYIYPLSFVRSALRCGSARQCERESEAYRRIASDLHNLVPVQSVIELRRRNARYELLGEGVPANECGIREAGQTMEPPDHTKGRIARALAYMVTTYELPMIMPGALMRGWSEAFPPSDEERILNRAIIDIQGNGNPYIVTPSLMNNF
ncbi:MAG: endonuclease [Marinobacter sp.]|nr:endonuclease [Marinobacter sp.]